MCHSWKWVRRFSETPFIDNICYTFRGDTFRIDEVDEGIMICSLMGHPNRFTGDFSLVSPSAFYIKDGEIIEGLPVITVSGNFYEFVKNSSISEERKMTENGYTCSILGEVVVIS